MKIATALILLCLAYNTYGRLVGGYSKVDLNNNDNKPVITKLTHTSIDAIEKHNQDHKILNLVDVESVKVQFISGIEYILVLHVQQVGCPDCEILNCSVRVFIDTASHGKETAKVYKCKPLPTPSNVKPHGEVPADRGGKEDPLGAFVWEDPEDRHVVSAARFAVSSINKMSNSMYSNVFIKVTDAKKQVVAGLNYNLTIRIGASSCRNTPENFGATLEKCGLKQNEMQICRVSVWDRIWMDPRYVINGFSCSQIGSNQAKPCDRGLFNKFKETYVRLYSTQEEDDHRFTVFCANMDKAKHLQDLDQGTARYGATKFADLTEEEFKQYVSAPWDLKANDGMKEAHIPEIDIPGGFDWRAKGAVTPVKNQGSCGSCWAFSTTGNIEGQWFIKNKKLYSLSEQELVDCDKVDHGCEGGLPSNAYNIIKKLGGLETEHDYPYAGADDKCTFNKSEAVVTVDSSVKISQDEKEMAQWLVQNGPISIGINANLMQFYWGGISHPWSIFCNPAHLDHGVLIVGFGVQGSTPYWIIKNSWGANWGEKGYYLIYRGAGCCGLNRMCTSAVV